MYTWFWFMLLMYINICIVYVSTILLVCYMHTLIHPVSHLGWYMLLLPLGYHHSSIITSLWLMGWVNWVPLIFEEVSFATRVLGVWVIYFETPFLIVYSNHQYLAIINAIAEDSMKQAVEEATTWNHYVYSLFCYIHVLISVGDDWCMSWFLC